MRRRQFIASAPMVGIAPYFDRLPFLDRTGRGEPAATGATTNVELAVDRWSVVPLVSAPPKLDGTLDDPAWRRSRPLGAFRTFYYTEQVDDAAVVYLLHDRRNLYIGVRYADADAGSSVVNFEGLVSPKSVGGPYVQVPIPVRSVTPPYVNSWGPDVTGPSGLPTSAKQTADAVTATAAVPLSTLGVDRVESGAEWRFNLIVQHEMMTKPFSAWSPIRTSLNNYSGRETADVRAEVTGESRLGAIFMGKLPPAASGEPVDYWLPEQCTLSYLGFTEKELSFALTEFGPSANVSVDWRTPTDGWQPVEDLRVEPATARLNLTFTHPGPLAKGRYELRILINNGSGTKLGIVTFDRDAMIRAGDALFAQ